jgi:hypothetical protein
MPLNKKSLTNILKLVLLHPKCLLIKTTRRKNKIKSKQTKHSIKLKSNQELKKNKKKVIQTKFSRNQKKIKKLTR